MAKQTGPQPGEPAKTHLGDEEMRMGYEMKMGHVASNVVFNVVTNLAVNVLLSVRHSRLYASAAGRSFC